MAIKPVEFLYQRIGLILGMLVAIVLTVVAMISSTADAGATAPQIGTETAESSNDG